ncbi:holin [Lysinibacillus sp. CNPSo 3705]|uniref:holin n=1 Tax=Lysinibacillus sp. CNPSo 3705 TaxID=3028148 RepID=UPI002363B58F|nr:holin [Lysinibacillus sp. CNPSo 3705]MDD1501615.1 holin [Lysinibacillus sp. CNPSo 3705]
MDLTNIFIVAMAIAAIVLAVSEVLKKTFNIKARYMPITSLVIGILIGLVFTPLSEYNAYVMAVAGAISGLTASGTFDLAKSLTKKDGAQ